MTQQADSLSAMPQTLSPHNSIGVLRYLLAFIIVVHHCNALLGTQYPLLIGPDIAVYAFFALSGFFVYTSYRRQASAWAFIRKRLLRLLPAYWAIVSLSAVLLVGVSTLPAADYFLSPQWGKYLLANLCLCNFWAPELPGVFADHALTAVNASLWYVKVEVIFTLLYPVMRGLTNVLNRRLMRKTDLFGPFLLVAWGLLLVGLTLGGQRGDASFPAGIRYVHYLQMFMLGILFSVYFPLLRTWRNFFWVFALNLVLIFLFMEVDGPVGEASAKFLTATSIVLILMKCFMMESPLWVLNRWNLSYSIYLCHFPLIQCALVLTSGIYVMPLAFLFIVLVAPLLYFGVEKRIHG